MKPGERPARVLAALGPKMLSLAAERADGAHPYLVTPEHTAKARAQLGPDHWLLPEQAVVLETDPDQARAIARRHLSRYLDLPNYTNNFRRLGFTDDDLASGVRRGPPRPPHAAMEGTSFCLVLSHYGGCQGQRRRAVARDAAAVRASSAP